ncbi:RCC1 domain-containing protein 1 isoform X4 [Artibeus jamaicensis]|uniref:RCC1 domain-containing protein 1 isoform X4 n=1 Tax=Artibeus jamaicensis TaxID=9417 RepID=UPI00235A7629|nr:RCC1 domain-containing protein 1 isoform X4 [Artibeus jamaicensis]
MAEERCGSWFGFGFCGFGQALGSGRGRQVHSPEPLRAPGTDADAEVCGVRASWSYTAFLSRECLGPIPPGPAPTCPRLLLSWLRASAGAGQVHLSGSARGTAEGCRDAWASETLLVVLRDGRGPGPGAELQAWAPGSALCGEPLWVQTVVPEAQREDGAGDGTRAERLPLLPGACAYVSPLPPFYRPLAPELRARRLELGTEHALLLDEAGQVYSWGGGRHGQLGHGTLEAEPEPRLLEALQGLPMAEVAAGGWHSVCVSGAGELYTWGWGKYGQLGHGDTSSWDRPCRVEYFVDKQLQATAVSCGPWNTYVYAVQREKS